MTYRTVATASAVVSAAYGLAALTVPNALASLFGITIDALATYEGRLLGGAYIGYAIANFLTRATADPLTRRAIAAANAVGWTLGFVVMTLGQLEGFANAMGWSSIVVALAFSLAWAWTYAAGRERGPAARRVRTQP